MAAALHVAGPSPDQITRSRSWRKRALLRSLGVAAALLALLYSGDDQDAFVNGLASGRPAGNVMITEELPQGMTCRAAYNYGDPERPVWNPMPQWNGEKTFFYDEEDKYRGHPSDHLRQWYHFDADGRVLGRLAQVVVKHLLGKDSILFGPDRDVGHFVIVTNCEKVRVTGRKYHYKLYYRNLTRRPGHLKIERFKSLQTRFPERIIMKAVWGMMAKTDYNKYIFRHRLKLFAGPNHLYYHENPIDFPMVRVKECRPELFHQRNDRASHWLKKVKPREDALVVKNTLKKQRTNLRLYKKFLMKHAKEIQDSGVELEKMDMAALVEAAEKMRTERLAPKFEGKTPNKIPKRYWPGTQFPMMPLGGNRKRRFSR